MPRFLTSLVRRVEDRLVDSMLRNLDERIKQIVQVPVVDGLFLVDVDVSSSGTTVVHGLERTPQGVAVVKSDAAVSYKTSAFDDTSFVIQSSSGDRVVSLWVF